MKNTIIKSLLAGFITSFSTLAMAADDYLDYGLYWFEGNNSNVKAVEHDSSVNAVPTNYYSDNKKTLILFHGWQNGSSQNNYNREGFYFSYADIQLAQAWKDNGWNVGLFFWNQFADEGEVKDAEAKIWSENGPRGMRYRLSDGSYRTTLAPSGKSVGRIAFEQVSAVLANNTSGDVRFAGHSLGNQLATFTAKQIYDADSSSPAFPNRIDLLDPFWSKDGKSYLGDLDGNGSNDWTGERVRWYLGEMITTHDIAVSWYKGSGILDLWIGDNNTSLESIVAFVHPRLWYLSSTDIATKHIHTKDIYLLSMSSAPPAEVTISGWFNTRTQTGNLGPSAATCDDRIREMMVSNTDWWQAEGRYTATTGDDMYEVAGNFDKNAPTENCL